MPLHPDVEVLAIKVRAKVVAWVRNERRIARDMTGACAIASYTLWRVLRARGRVATLVLQTDEYEAHCWVELSGYVVDITATQFDGPPVAIYPIGQEPEWCDTQHLDRRVTNQKALEVLKRWDEQSPFRYKRKIDSLVSRLSTD
jgi:hypothetical protein